MLHQAPRLLATLCTLSPLNSNLCHSCNQLYQRDLVAPSSTTCRQMTFSISLSSEMIIITVLLVLTSKTAAYSTQNTIMRPNKSFFRLHAGFGQSKNKVDSQSGLPNLVNPQLQPIKEDATCPCSSGLKYEACCKILHDGKNGLHDLQDPVTITRARYSSFAVGSAAYIIDTTHPSHREYSTQNSSHVILYTLKDYKRHSGSHLDPKKARKAWEKEIITKNSEVYDFLKLEILEGEEKLLQSQKESLLDGQESVAFRILVRKRSDGSLITFMESSVYVRAATDHVPLGLKSPPSKGLATKGKSSPTESLPSEGKGWLYSHGVVTPVPDDIAKRIMGEAPQFLNNLSIRDRW